jgi:hypothetical protein
MSGTARVLLVAVTCGIVSGGVAGGSDLLVGGENWRFETDVDVAGGGGDLVAHHSSSSVTAEWRATPILSVNLNFGQLTSSLEDEPTGGTIGSGDGYQLLVGISLEQELDTGGGLLIDGSYSWGWTKWDSTREYDHTRGHMMLAYIFGRGDKSRVYTGIAYDVYESDIKNSAGPDSSFENDQSLSIVAGVRARADTFVGRAELCGFGEWGFRLGLSFGF